MCIENCQVCNNTSCSVCNSMHYLDEVGGCSLCEFKFPNCQFCDGSVCKQCKSKYGVNSDGQCELCPKGCDWCQNGECLICDKGFYLDTDGQCKMCTSNCFNCNITTCFSCKSDFYLDSSEKCRPCPDNCNSCTEAGCNYCDYGFFVGTDNKCHSCSEKFGYLCNSCNEAACYYRDNHFFTSTDGTCAKCSDWFPGCDQCDHNHCLKCSLTYYMDINSNCNPCGSGCADCLNPTSCKTCLNGELPYSDGTCECNIRGSFFNSVTNRCDSCNVGCRSCDNSESCSKCWASGMASNGDGSCSCVQENYVFANGQCRPCSDYACETCKRIDIKTYSDYNYNYYSTTSSYNYNDYSVRCLTCKDGHYLWSGNCYSCPSGCSECSASTKQCKKCFDPDNMLIDDKTGACYCKPGYRWDDLTHSCKPCLSGCANCEGREDWCETCFDPKYMINGLNGICYCPSGMPFNQTSFRCEFLPSNCAEYGSSGCTRCNQGFFLYDNSGVLECLSCSESCNSCDPHPGCYLCGTTIEKDSSTCTSDNSVGYLTSFEDGNLILDFAYDLPEPLSLKEIIIKSPGNFDTSSWRMTQITARQYMITTNLQESDFPIDVRFKFNRG
ncbi:unnamed protein product [Blepharisma stoltei]|uniref:Uncharacterized protein n=1 Tax=Blepharisma stoltei TaxID=1481888 RepID=A0AAU9J889_9CILI|nr:unnamed protein product [Blepharisma stoltei]